MVDLIVACIVGVVAIFAFCYVFDWNEKRKEIQERIDALLRAPSAHQIYIYD